MANIEHKDIVDAQRHEPKGASTAPVGYILVSNGDGTTSWVAQPAKGTTFGWFDYNDLATQTTPINVVGGVDSILSNDGLGPFTNKTYPPVGVADLWDSSTTMFDFSGLSLGDTVDIRLDVEITTSVANQEVEVVLEMAVGGSVYEIPFTYNQFKSSGVYSINRFTGIYMGDTNTLNNGARFLVRSPSACTVKVNGWYVRAGIV